MAFSVKDPSGKENIPPSALSDRLAVPSGPEEAKRASRYCPGLPELVAKGRRIVLSPWSLAIFGLAVALVTLVYSFRPAYTYDLKLGSGYDTPYLNLTESGFGRPVQAAPDEDERGGRAVSTPADAANVKPTAPEELPQQSYRWTRERPILLLPGIGSAPTRLTIQAAGSPLIRAGQSVEVLLNGQPFSRFDLQAGVPSTHSFDFGPERIAGGSLTVEMRVKALGPVDARAIEQYPGTYVGLDKNLYQGQTGFKLYSARIEAGAGSPGLPPLGVLGAIVVSAWLLYFGLAYAGLTQKWAFGVTALLTGLAGFGLAFSRLNLTVYTGRLALLLLLTVGLLPVLDWAMPRLLRRWGLPLPGWAWQGLLILFLVGMIGRGGGLIYPNIEVSDAPFHLRQIDLVLHEPDGPAKQWSNKENSKVPAQWESQAIIPYSPFVYFYLAPVAALPLDPNVSVNLFNALLDAGRVFIIFGLAAALGAGARAALVAAGLYLITPSTWMLNSWGNWPTTVSLWLATLYLLLVLVGWRWFGSRPTWAGATFVLLLTMLCYSVTAVFMGMLLIGWSLGLLIWGGREALARRNALLLLASVGVAAVLAVALYYFQFIPDLAKTLTSFGSSLESKGSLGGFGDRSLDYYLGLYANHVFFRYGAGAFIVIGLIVYGWLVMAPRRASADEGEGADLDRVEPNLALLRGPVHLWLGAAWWLVFLFFGLAQWKVDMVNKQVWFVLPYACVLTGLGLVWLWQRYRTPATLWASRLAVAGLILWTTYSASALWLERVFIKRR